MRDMLRETWHRCLAVLQGRRHDADFNDELQTHLDLATEERGYSVKSWRGGDDGLAG